MASGAICDDFTSFWGIICNGYGVHDVGRGGEHVFDSELVWDVLRGGCELRVLSVW